MNTATTQCNRIGHFFLPYPKDTPLKLKIMMFRLMFIKSRQNVINFISLRSTVLPELTEYQMTLKVPESWAVQAAA